MLHDWLCGQSAISRYDADGIFRRSMRELGVSDLRRYVMWSAVRLGSGFGAIGAVEKLAVFLLGLFSLVLAVVFCLNPSIAVGIALPVAFFAGVALIPKGSSIAERLLIGLLVTFVFILAIVPSALVVLVLVATWLTEMFLVAFCHVFGREYSPTYKLWWT